MDYELVCTRCENRYGKNSPHFRCDCGGILEIRYDYSTLRLPKNFRKETPYHRKYLPFFPIKELVSMGEGNSELIRTKNIGFPIDKMKLFLKIETENPTRTFKDRGSSVEIAKAKELGFKEICCASTGNMGLSLATYARKSGMRCTVFISRSGNREKIDKIRKAGARLVFINGDFNKCLSAAEEFAKKNNVFVCGDYHYRKEGQKSVGFEIIDQLGRVPDYIFVQVGNSTLLAAIFKALNEYKRIGLIKRLPKLVAVQSMQCDPLVRAFKEKRGVKYITPKTEADAIAVGFPTFGFEGLNAISKTKGDAIAVHDRSILWTSQKLARHMGIKSELGGAAGLTGFLEMYGDDMGRFKGKTVVAIITGNNEG
ncbi:MAG: threonine synthase [Candidatus Micrarchaeales archaeon]|nr:threonine synthase [Candidatus Micrarchaeales archaeon]